MRISRWIVVAAMWGLSACTHGLIVSLDEDIGPFDTAVNDTEADTQVDTQVDTQLPSDPGDDTEVETGGCGDGFVIAPEVCDDGNNLPGDGCTSNCSFIEDNYDCPEPGSPCLSRLTCGDGLIAGDEQCDDKNAASGDGCSSICVIEAGWTCPNMGYRCVAAACGDGLWVGSEECDDGDTDDNDGCSATCKLEDGWACDTAGEACDTTECNDGVKEGSEPCDDGNLVIGDGCTPFCEVEPDCSAGACSSACGDGMILVSDTEACDDGNTVSGDGCSETCEEETGFTCQLVDGQLSDSIDVPVTFRDFIAFPLSGFSRHPDFEHFSGFQPTRGLVATQLGGNGKPVYTGICEDDADPANNSNSTLDSGLCPYWEQMTGEAEFNQWYSDDTDVNVTKVEHMTLNRDSDDSFKHLVSGFYPWDNQGWVDSDVGGEHHDPDPSYNHNYGFTSEIRYWFEYKGGEQLYFSGDDDVWVFINGILALDLGGMHPERDGSVTLDTEGVATEEDVETGIDRQIDLGMEVGNIYEVVLFHAERHSNGSNFNLTLTEFEKRTSTCVTKCGDGIVAGDEVCDLGTDGNNGGYGECDSDCLGRGPFCGDSDPDAEYGELCDDGFNNRAHSFTDTAACAPGCVFGAYCGDSELNGSFGEECDDGLLDGGYNECGAGCRIDMFCGDSEVQEEYGEECDDGNQVSGDGCTKDCLEQFVPD